MNLSQPEQPPISPPEVQAKAWLDLLDKKIAYLQNNAPADSQTAVLRGITIEEFGGDAINFLMICTMDKPSSISLTDHQQSIQKNLTTFRLIAADILDKKKHGQYLPSSCRQALQQTIDQAGPLLDSDLDFDNLSAIQNQSLQLIKALQKIYHQPPGIEPVDKKLAKESLPEEIRELSSVK